MKRKLILLIFIVLLGILSLIFYMYQSSRKVTFHSSGNPVKYDLKSKISPYRSQEPLLNFIANRRWNNVIATGPFVEGGVWTFFGDGAFKFSIISDYISELNGNWKLVELGGGEGLIFLDYSTNKKVMFLKAENKHLNIEYQPYWGEEIPTKEVKKSMVLINSNFIINNFPEYAILLRKKWIKDNDTYKDSIPHELTFYDNGKFFANYIRPKPCNFYGNWTIYGVEPGRVEIRLFAPESNCDLRGYKGYGWGGGYIFKLAEKKLTNESFDYLNYHTD